MLVLKLFTLLFTINTERIKSLCMKRQLLLHTKRWLPLGMKRQSPMYMKRWSPLPPRINSVDCLYINCQSPQHWSLICPTDQQRQLPFHMKVKVDFWSSMRQLLIPRINRGDHLFMQKWKFTVDPLWGDCWSLLPTPPPGSTEVIAFSYESESWLFILSEAFINPPRRFADFEQMLGSTSACLASQRTFPFGKSNKPHTVDVIYFTFADFRVAQ